jgi:hypothetical protein
MLTAMGSHGGATAEGQTEVLASYGVTEKGVGAPILASMKTNDDRRHPGGLFGLF